MNKNKTRNKSSFEGYGSHSGSSFISFADVTSDVSHNHDTTAITTSSNKDVLLTPIYRGNDIELAVSCKHMMKKDMITKLKSLKEVMTLLQDRPHVIHDFLPYFIHVFPRLYLDNDRKIREQLFTLLMTIVILDKQSLTLYMKHLIGYWYIGTADPCIEVSDMAISALEKAIPPKKREPVLLYLSTPLLKQIRYYLDQKPETLSDMNVTTQDDALERYERIYISTTSCISRLVTFLSPEGNKQLIDNNIINNGNSSISHEMEEKVGYSLVLTNGLYKKLTAKKINFRKCTLQLVIAVTNALGPYIEQQDNKTSLMDTCAVLRSLLVLLGGEKDRTILSLTVDALLVVAKHEQSMEFWSQVDIQRQLLQPILLQIKQFPEVMLSSVLAIIGVMPIAFTSVHSKLDGIKSRNDDDSNTTMIHDQVSQFIDDVALMTEEADSELANNQLNVLRVDVFVAESSLVLLLRRPMINDDNNNDYMIKSDDDEIYLKRKAILSHRLVKSVVLALEGVSMYTRDDHNKQVVQNMHQAIDKVVAQIARTSSSLATALPSILMSLVDAVCERFNVPESSPIIVSSLLQAVDKHEYEQLWIYAKEKIISTCVDALSLIKNVNDGNDGMESDDLKICTNIRKILDMLMTYTAAATYVSTGKMENELDEFISSISDRLLTIWCQSINTSNSGRTAICQSLYQLIPLELLSDTNKVYHYLHTILTVSFNVGCYSSVYTALCSMICMSTCTNNNFDTANAIKLCSDVLVVSVGTLEQWIEKSMQILISKDCKSSISLPPFTTPIDMEHAVGFMSIFLQLESTKQKCYTDILQRVKDTQNLVYEHGQEEDDGVGVTDDDNNASKYMTKVSRWAVLSCYEQEKQLSSSSDSPSSITIPNGIPEPIIIDILVYIFFNRQRSRRHLTKQRKFHKDGSTGGNYMDKLILSWTCVCKLLLPCLSADMKRQLGDAIISQLREKLLLSFGTPLFASKKLEITTIQQSRKLARHICAVRSLLDSGFIELGFTGPYDFIHIYEQVGLLDMTVLETLMKAQQADVSSDKEGVVMITKRLIDCLVDVSITWKKNLNICNDDEDEVEDMQEEEDENEETPDDIVKLQMHLPHLTQETLPLYHALCHICSTETENTYTRTRIHTVSSDANRAVVRDCILRCLSTLPSPSCHHIANLLLTRVTNGVHSSVAAFYRSTASMLTATYSSLHPMALSTSGQQCTSSNKPSSIHKILKIQSITEQSQPNVGTVVYYVSDKKEDGYVTATHATLVAMDRQAGEAPFYTVKLTHDNLDGIEKQTESSNLFLLSNGVHHQGREATTDLTVQDKVDLSDIDVSNVDADIRYLMMYINRSVHGSDDTSTNSFMVGVHHDVHLGLYLIKTILPTLTYDVAPILRGLCITLIKKGRMYMGILLLEALGSTTWGRGHGVWMLLPLQSLLAHDIIGSVVPPEQCVGLCDIHSSYFECTLVTELVERLTKVMCQQYQPEEELINTTNIKVKIAFMRCCQHLHGVGSKLVVEVAHKAIGVCMDILCTNTSNSNSCSDSEDDDHLLHAKAVAVFLVHILLSDINGHQRQLPVHTGNTISRSNMIHQMKHMESRLIQCMMDSTIQVEFRLAVTKCLECLYDIEECLSPLVLEAIDMVKTFEETVGDDDEEHEDHDQMERDLGKQIAIRTITGPIFSTLSKGLLRNASSATSHSSPTRNEVTTSSQVDTFALICALRLALKKLDTINLHTQVMSSCPERSHLCVVKSLTANYIKSSGMLDAAMKLLFKTGALVYSQATTETHSSISSPSSSLKKNAHKFHVLDLCDTISLDKHGDSRLRQLAAPWSLSTQSRANHELNRAQNITGENNGEDNIHLHGLAAGCLRKIICVLPSYVRSWWLEDAPEVKVSHADHKTLYIHVYIYTFLY